MSDKVVAVVSGGMDSVTLAYRAAQDGAELTCVSFDYGQRHVKELLCARRCAERLSAEHIVMAIPSLGALGDSALTDDIDVPEGHYAADNMRLTVVPNRNMIMLALATAVAVTRGAARVETAVHAGDHFVYPDCRPAFIDAVSHAARLGTDGFAPEGFAITAPFVHLTKAHIVRLGEEAGVAWDETWSCYKGADVHCGRCGTCVERREAFELAGVTDPTVYDLVTP